MGEPSRERGRYDRTVGRPPRFTNEEYLDGYYWFESYGKFLDGKTWKEVMFPTVVEIIKEAKKQCNTNT